MLFDEHTYLGQGQKQAAILNTKNNSEWIMAFVVVTAEIISSRNYWKVVYSKKNKQIKDNSIDLGLNI